MTNAERRQLLDNVKAMQAQNQPVSYLDALNGNQSPQVAVTPEQQQQGLRGRETPQAMTFPKVAPHTPFNTVGMKFPIDIKKYNDSGHLVKSYNNVPPGIVNLPTGPQTGTVVETPAMQKGGIKKAQSGLRKDTMGPNKNLGKFDLRVNPHTTVAESTGTQTPVFQSRKDIKAQEQSRLFNQTDPPKGGILHMGNAADYFDSGAVYHDNPRYNNLIRKQVYAGTHGYNPQTGELVKLDTPVKVDPATQAMATEEYTRATAGTIGGITDAKTDAYVESLPEDQRQALKDRFQEQRRQGVQRELGKMYQNPITYLPGAIATLPFTGPAMGAMETIGTAGRIALTAPLTVGSRTIPYITAGDVIGAGFATTGAYNLSRDLDSGFYTDPNIPTSQKVERGVITGLDLLGTPGVGRALASVPGALRTTGKFFTTQTPKQLPGSGAVSSADDIGKVLTQVPQAPKPTWQMKELPGLHLKSTMEGEAISKIIDKTGKINTEQALGIIGKESGGADKVALIKQGLGETLPKKMDYYEFRKVVQDQLIPLERQFSTQASNYGVGKLGYPSPKRSSYEMAMKSNKDEIARYEKAIAENPRVTERDLYILKNDQDALLQSKNQLLKSKEQLSKLPLENQTLILGNKNKFGRGSSAHGNPDETLGHVHFLRDAETPDVLTVTQIQSDAFQGTHRRMPTGKLNKTGEPIEFDYQGNPIDNDYIDEVGRYFDKATGENITQKKLLDKNHQERYLQELVDYAGKRGDVNKIRVPTSETAAKVQGYSKNTASGMDDMGLPTDLGYSPEHQTILKKYSEQPKTIKKLFGKEPQIVTDSKGNTWYEFDIPKKFKEGKGEIKAFSWAVPATIGAGAAAAAGSEPKMEDLGKSKMVKKAQSGLATRQDSLALTTNALAKMQFYDNNPDYVETPSYTDFKDKATRQRLIDSVVTGGSGFAIDEYLIKSMVEGAANRGEPFSQKETMEMFKTLGQQRFGAVKGTGLTSFGDILSSDADNYYNPLAPPIYLHPNIEPQGSRSYASSRIGDSTDIPFYDPLAIAPFDTLDEEQQAKRVELFGASGVPNSYLIAHPEFGITPSTPPPGAGPKKRPQIPVPDRMNSIGLSSYLTSKELAKVNTNVPESQKKSLPIMRADNFGSRKNNPRGQYQIGEQTWNEYENRWVYNQWSKEEREQSAKMARESTRKKAKQKRPEVYASFQSGGYKPLPKY